MSISRLKLNPSFNTGSLDFARGYIVMAWSPTSQENPIALLSAILRGLVSRNQNVYHHEISLPCSFLLPVNSATYYHLSPSLVFIVVASRQSLK